MDLIWSPEARADLHTIHAYVSEQDPEAAARLVRRIVFVIEERLLPMPEIGRPGRVPGTRELVVAGTPFIVPYRVVGNTIQLLRVYHAARRWPDRL